MLTTTYRIRRWTNRVDLTGVQKLERVTKLLGITIFVWVLDTEEVPSWAFIQRATLGRSDWESRLFREYSKLLMEG